jgi:hypothetical protein
MATEQFITIALILALGRVTLEFRRKKRFPAVGAEVSQRNLVVSMAAQSVDGMSYSCQLAGCRFGKYSKIGSRVRGSVG